MTTGIMASPPTSNLRFLTPSGDELEAPLEWMPALVEIPGIGETWPDYRLTAQGRDLPLSHRRVGGVLRVVADWPRSGTGNYELVVDGPTLRGAAVVSVISSKISVQSYATLVEDLQLRIPTTVALALQQLGGMAGAEFLRGGETTIAGEIARLRLACNGHRGRMGLLALLPRLNRDPHSALRSVELWVPAGRARRPHASRLGAALSRPANMTATGPANILDSRVEHTFDVHENRLVQAFCREVARRIRRVSAVVPAGPNLDELRVMRDKLETARRAAPFLDAVGLPTVGISQVSMVLLKNPDYRALLEGYLAFHRLVDVQLDTPLIEVALEELPRLYELWCTLIVIETLADVGHELGFRLDDQSLMTRKRDGYLMRVLPSGRPALVLSQPDSGVRVMLVPQRTFGPHGEIRSVTYEQRPDISVVVEKPGRLPALWVFDPKYKLDSESAIEDGEAELELGSGVEDARRGGPKKVDIDKMHTYRDAICAGDDVRVTEFAAIMYPGGAREYPGGIEAMSAVPGSDGPLRNRLRVVLQKALNGDADRTFTSDQG